MFQKNNSNHEKQASYSFNPVWSRGDESSPPPHINNVITFERLMVKFYDFSQNLVNLRYKTKKLFSSRILMMSALFSGPTIYT